MAWTISWSCGTWTDFAASTTRAMSSREISRAFPETATTPRLLKERTAEPESPAKARVICAPAMISASSAERLIASTVESTLMMFPLRAPRCAVEPFPRMSRPPRAFGSPISTQTFDDPMSQDTRKFSGLAIRPISSAVSPGEHHTPVEAQIDRLRLDPARVHLRFHGEQGAYLLRGIDTQDFDRYAQGSIHDTESSGKTPKFRRLSPRRTENFAGASQGARRVGQRSSGAVTMGKSAAASRGSYGAITVPRVSSQNSDEPRRRSDRGSLDDRDAQACGSSLDTVTRSTQGTFSIAAEIGARLSRRGSFPGTERGREHVAGARAAGAFDFEPLEIERRGPEIPVDPSAGGARREHPEERRQAPARARGPRNPRSQEPVGHARSLRYSSPRR
jgi:hypothetical protein